MTGASFQEVIRQYLRMHHAYYSNTCDGCPFKDFNKLTDPTIKSKACKNKLFIDPIKTEIIIMKWAKDHPEPVYPTWKEWLLSIGVLYKVPDGVPVELANGDFIEPDYRMRFRGDEHIPYEFAQRFGIEPKEVDNDG